MISEKLADQIIERRRAELKKQITSYQRKNLILSDIADCDRYLAYSVLEWDKRPLHDEDLQARFNAGRMWEREAIRELEGLGYEIILSQQPVQIKNRKGDVIATGKIDGFVVFEHEGKKIQVPIEIKTMQPNIFNTIKGSEDFQKRPYLRKYPRQLMLYMFGNNTDEGLFLLLDGLGRWKLLPLALDYGACEWLLQRIERTHEAIQAKQFPDRIPYDSQICGKCAFSHICLPDVLNKAADMIDNPDLEADIARHEEIKPIAAEYDQLHNTIKETFKGIEKAMVGTRFLVQNIPSARTTYELPADVEQQIDELKKSYAKKVPVTRLVIEDLESKNKAEEAA